ncbi:MAG: trypsin-like peptidase domain-containing protein [Candidatus Poribacteria bacterium]|nr:trypsin-like peptidase domain-containing protein [Candidatus Poribacteria bacterium]
MYKRLFLIFVFVTTTLTTTNVLGQEVSLAQQVLRKHSKTFQRWDVRELLPSVLTGLKNSDIEDIPGAIRLVITLINAGQAETVKALAQRLADVTLTDDHITLLKDPAIQALLNDEDVKKLLNDPAAIDELARLLGVSEPEPGVTPELDLPAQQIYDQAIDSVVWIQTTQGNRFESKGSGVLIDKERLLVVTNEHVIRNAEQITVYFPWRDDNRKVNKNEDFYFQNWKWLKDGGYVTTNVRVIRQNVRNDLAIIQLDRLSPIAREIKHNFSRNVDDSMEKGDKVHILGNPGNRLWNLTQGTFLRPWQVCTIEDGELVGCLEMEGDIHGGNSGGPVLNGQGMLIGILTAGTDETVALASPARNVKALLDTVPTNLPPIPPQRTYPKRTFKIINRTGVTVHYEIRWSQSDSWKSNSVQTGFIKLHTSGGQNIPSGYPRIRFDYIAGDKTVTYRQYTLETVESHQNNNNAPTYRFEYNQWGDELDLLKGAAPTVYPKRKFKIRNHTGVTVPYQIRWSNSNNWQSESVETGYIITHQSSGQNIPPGYPKIRFDYIAGDGKVTYLVYNLASANANANVAPAYLFEFNEWGDRLDLYRDGSAAPALSKAIPKETVLLSNYPNPFNPETWIPYKLSKPAGVTVSIYAADGRLIRKLALGHQPAGMYRSKSRAAYWDGRNAQGEPVASGVYFYTFKADDFTATRKMLIRK